ncbi:uncharacterized protein G2W53_044925 [Senna tora]|uniref:Uncharacterized protein n=1 Tax=Senna tora TaxID=362788 RepID=A0A834SH38_9FABA|nr:uncharacterized protein G2W53_044925 [Senna tora]
MADENMRNEKKTVLCGAFVFGGVQALSFCLVLFLPCGYSPVSLVFAPDVGDLDIAIHSSGRISRGGICSKRGHARQTRLTSSYPRSSTSPPLSPPLDGSSSHPSLEPSDVPVDASPQAEPQPSTHPQGLSDSSNNAQPPMVGKDPTDGRTWIIPDGDT